MRSEQQYINDKKISNFKVLNGFDRDYIMYEDPNDSNILASAQEYEQFRLIMDVNKEQPESNLGYKVAMKKNKPVNLTKEQKEIQRKIQDHEDKVSQVTVSDSRFFSDILEPNPHQYSQCQMCKARDLVIKDKQNDILKLESQVKQLETQAKKDKEEIFKLKQFIASFPKQSLLQFENPEKRYLPEDIKQKKNKVKEQSMIIYPHQEDVMIKPNLRDSVNQEGSDLDMSKSRESLNSLVNSLTDTIKMSRKEGASTYSQILRNLE